MAHKREIERRLNGEEGSPSHYDSVVVCGLMANLLLGRLLDHFDLKRSNKEQKMAEERAAGRFLAAALKDFDEAQREFGPHFPYPYEQMSLLQKFYWRFYNMTRIECERDAAEILAFIAGVEAEQSRQVSAA